MKHLLRAFLVGVAATAMVAPVASAEDRHKIFVPDAVSWTSGPPSLPAGAQAAVLYGNPGEEGLFALRLKLPAEYTIPPHTHPRPEVVTVISGSFHLGMGGTANRDAARKLPEGSFFALPPGTAHHAYTTEETIIQINSTGPWTIKYVNPADDPRQ
jgi:quercetin dioxygenase-like cupin family protein